MYFTSVMFSSCLMNFANSCTKHCNISHDAGSIQLLIEMYSFAYISNLETTYFSHRAAVNWAHAELFYKGTHQSREADQNA